MEEKTWCYLHPEQVVIGVCHLCLNEKLLFLVAAKQGHHYNYQNPITSNASHRHQSFMHNRKPSSTSIHKIFAFGNSLFSRPESQKLKSANYDIDASPSPEESFISMKFEENGVALWEKNSASNKVPIEKSQILKKEDKSMVQHVKSNNAFRWRKRIGHIFHLIQWRRTTKGGVCHVGSKVEGVKVRKSWMRTLTRKKTME
ncbi:unnamed protein product [Lupinus luteus]|uniref:Uncharacterized protein n=1 Tax=Lupinus luteus TaxID=3873 RepID=A0AAV1X8D9_LUPLU